MKAKKKKGAHRALCSRASCGSSKPSSIAIGCSWKGGVNDAPEIRPCYTYVAVLPKVRLTRKIWCENDQRIWWEVCEMQTGRRVVLVTQRLHEGLQGWTPFLTPMHTVHLHPFCDLSPEQSNAARTTTEPEVENNRGSCDPQDGHQARTNICAV